MENKIFWTGIEYSYMKDAEEYGKLKGGFVYVFVKGFDVREVYDKIILGLNERNLSPIEIEFVKPYENDLEWETAEQTEHYLSLFNEASGSNDLIFDNFHAYEQG